MTKPNAAVAEIIKLVPKSGKSLPWWHRVPPDVAAALPSIMQAWRDGEFGKYRRPAAKAISEWLRKNGVQIGEQGVDHWFRQNEK